MGKAKARSRNPQSTGSSGGNDDFESRVTSAWEKANSMSRQDIIGFMKKNNVRTPISEAENVPSSNIGCFILRSGFVCNTFQEVYSRSMLNGALWASTPTMHH